MKITAFVGFHARSKRTNTTIVITGYEYDIPGTK